MSFLVRAEKGSRIRVETESGHRIAKATARGADQKIAFRAKTGRHTYVVTATDDSGNESVEAVKTVSVDATAPKLSAVTGTAGTSATGKSTLSFTSEPGAKWTLAGVGPKTLRGTVNAKSTVLSLWLPNGSYRPRVVVKDKVGNVTTKTARMGVHVKSPLLRVDRNNAPTVHQLTYTLTGTPRSTGRLVMKHLDDVPFRINDDGSSTITIPTTDGTYGPGRVTLTDFAGRQTSQAVPEVVIDTAAPHLDISADENQALAGILALTVVAEPGTTLRVNADLHGATLAETATATAEPVLIRRTPAAGIYTVTATAEDAVGNQTTRQIQVEVVVPATTTDIVVGLLLLLLLCAVPVAAALVAWRQRHRIRAWRARRAALAQQRAAERAAAAAEAVYQGELAAHRTAWAAYESTDAAWRHGYNQLAALARTAETFRPSHDAAGLIPLRRGELSYGVFNTTMVEERPRQGTVTLVDAAVGSAVITSQRVVSVATRNREWTFDHLQGVRMIGTDLILLPVRNRKNPSGIRLGRSDVDKFRLQLDLALADKQGSRAEVVSQYRSRLESHSRQRPAPPNPPTRPQPTVTALNR